MPFSFFFPKDRKREENKKVSPGAIPEK